MELKLTRNDAPRRSNMAVFAVDGCHGSVRFSKSLFVNKQAPATLTLSDAAFAGPRVKETAEQRKARLKAMTPAEKLARMEARIAKMKARLGNAIPVIVPRNDADQERLRKMDAEGRLAAPTPRPVAKSSVRKKR